MIREKYMLYDTLLKKRKLTKENISDLKINIKKLNKKQQEAVVLLIFEHSLRETEQDSIDTIELPYSIKCDKNSTVINLDELPKELKCILVNFIEHISEGDE